jgi:hypothetical protein
MAQFLKVEAVTEPQTLIPISEIVAMAAVSDGTDTTLTITLKGPGASAKYTVVVKDPAGGTNAMVESFNKAIVANPGGVVSTVVPPLTTAQAPAAQSGQKGRIVITQPAIYTKFASCLYSAV